MKQSIGRHLTAFDHLIFPNKRQKRYGHEGGVVWLTGLSASGKSSLAMGLEAALITRGYACYTLDGDNLRLGLNADLGFLPAERTENIRRVGEVAALFADAGLICITALISPYSEDRAKARHAARHTHFHEIHVAADLAACEARDPKGLYRKARIGLLSNFTGIDAPYQAPASPELRIETGQELLEASLEKLLAYVTTKHPLESESPRVWWRL